MKNVFEDVWVLLLNELFEFGEDVEKDDARIKEVIGVHKWIPSPYKNSPVNVTSDIFINSVKKGFFDIEGYHLKSLDILVMLLLKYLPIHSPPYINFV